MLQTETRESARKGLALAASPTPASAVWGQWGAELTPDLVELDAAQRVDGVEPGQRAAQVPPRAQVKEVFAAVGVHLLERVP